MCTVKAAPTLFIANRSQTLRYCLSNARSHQSRKLERQNLVCVTLTAALPSTLSFLSIDHDGLLRGTTGSDAQGDIRSGCFTRGLLRSPSRPWVNSVSDRDRQRGWTYSGFSKNMDGEVTIRKWMKLSPYHWSL